MMPQPQISWMIGVSACALALPLSVLAKAGWQALRTHWRVRRAGAAAAQVIERNARLFAADLGRSGATLSGLLAALARETDPGARDGLVDAFARDASLSPAALVRLSSLAAAVLELGGPEQAPVGQSLEPATLVEQALRQVLTSPGAPDLSVRLRSAHTRKLRGDPRSLVSALAHLLDNAVAAAGPTGRLWIECRDVERGDVPYVAICVGNSGPPIAEDLRELIFQPFFTSGKEAAAGLGLAVVRRVATRHRGRIDLRTISDQGTEFVLTLPAALMPSRYRPQCLHATLRGIASALAPAARLGMA